MTSAFIQYVLINPFLRWNGQEWSFLPDLTAKMIKVGAVKRAEAVDSFGNLYTPNLILKTIGPQLPLDRFAANVAAFRLAGIYSGLSRFGQTEQNWVERLFASGRTLPPDILDILVAKKYLDPGMIYDPWGTRYAIRDKGASFSNGYMQYFKTYEVRSAGPDRKLDTADDVTNPYAIDDIRYHLYALNRREEDAGGWGDGARAKILEAVPMLAPPMPAMAGAMAPRAAAEQALPTSTNAPAGQPAIRVREYFPETLLWEPALITDSLGRAELNVPMADSITTWRLTALGHSATGLFGSNTTGIRVFQDFFVDIDFPVQLTQSDEVEVPIAVYNYLPGAQTVTLEVREHDGFELLSPASQQVRLAAGQVDVRYFRVRAAKIGRQTLTVYAMGTKLSDAIKRSVDIIPNGLRVEDVHNGRLSGNLDEEIVIPEFAIPEASRIMVKIYPGVFAQVLEGLDGIFRMPSGCFEQTTSTTYPNVMVLAYMKKTGIISPEIQMKAEQYINLGYQRLLSFEVPGGGFEWFGSPPAHNILTAYGLMEFSDMSKVYPIDPAVITRTQAWLAKRQEADGSWKPAEHWIETLSGEAFSRSLELNTAYITWSLADTGYQGEAVGKGIRYLKSRLREVKDAYTLALALNALVAANPKDQDALDLIKRLDQLKVEDAKTGAVHWEPAGQTAVHGQGTSGMIETTALIVYAMIKAGQNPATVNKGLAWIAQQKDAFGTFQTTQATVLSLKALLAAEGTKAPDVRGDITVTLGGRSEKVEIAPENSEVLRLLDFQDQTHAGRNLIRIQAREDMGLMYQVVGIFYIPWDKVKLTDQKPLLSLEVKYDRTQLRADDILTANVIATYHGEKATDMVILDLGLPPGFALIPDRLEQLKADNIIEKFTTTGRQLTIYVRRLEAGKPLRFSYQLKAKFPVRAQAPRSAAYEYYTPDIRVETPPVPLEITR